MKNKFCFFLLTALTIGLIAGCGNTGNSDKSANTSSTNQSKTEKNDTQEKEPSSDIAPELSHTEKMREMFGENCIAEQTFEVELSGYKDNVYFVPYAPSSDNPEFCFQIVQDGRILSNISAYVPYELQNEVFTSLDAVSFYDVNYDAQTDIVLIETYGDTSFAAVYFNAVADVENPDNAFIIQEDLSVTLTAQTDDLSISGIRNFLSGGKRNGKFSDYREAYKAVSLMSRFYGSEDGETYDLIYFDEDNIPELAAGKNGYYVSLYTYKDGMVYTLMDQWVYGAFGNAGYEYLPYRNSMRNYNSDFAGAIVYTTYASINKQHVLETTEEYVTYNFDDVNENGYPDEAEEASLGNYSVTYLNGEKLADIDYDSSDPSAFLEEEYKYIETTMSLDELNKALK